MSELARRPDGDVAGLTSRLASGDLDRSERGRLLVRLTRLLGAGARAAGARAVFSGRYLADLVVGLGPHLPVRDLLTLHDHYGGLTGDDLAAALVRSASLVTAGIGAAAGALAAAELAAPPALLAAPVQVAAETLAVVAVELKLVAELHVVYGRQPRGNATQTGLAYIGSWVTRTSVNASSGPVAVLSSALTQQLRSRLVRRAGRNLGSLAPFLAGAVAGAELNRRETRHLGESLIASLTP